MWAGLSETRQAPWAFAHAEKIRFLPLTLPLLEALSWSTLGPAIESRPTENGRVVC